MVQSKRQKAMDRVGQMEQCFDMLKKAVSENPAGIREDSFLKSQLQRLIQYYESGQWLHDYELDEAGCLPQDLKRGILAQDAIYDLLEQIADIDK